MVVNPQGKRPSQGVQGDATMTGLRVSAHPIGTLPVRCDAPGFGKFWALGRISGDAPGFENFGPWVEDLKWQNQAIPTDVFFLGFFLRCEARDPRDWP